MRTAVRLLFTAILIVVLLVLGFAFNVMLGMRAHAQTRGTISGLPLHAPVSIARDDRGIPHIVASNEHDVFFAQGYVEGADRLFQMDLLRRYVLGELATVFGPAALQSDETQRAIPVRQMVAAQWQQLDVESREILGAFSDGVNAAMAREPLPVEFRLMAYRPERWTPLDSLAVAMATVLDLTDDWNDIEPRDAAYRAGGLQRYDALFPFTDPCYNAPVLLGLAHVAAGSPCKRDAARAAVLEHLLEDSRAPVGSNEWAAGATHTRERRALLANDPHLGLRMPGVWYLIDLRAPGFRVAGATLPGCPGVVLGHNARLAWGATNGTVTSLSVYDPPPQLDPARWESERFSVRLRASVTRRYYRTPREFGVTTKKGRFLLVRWNAYQHPVSPAFTFLALDRAPAIEAALRALARYPGPTQNFELADTSGRVAYALAGEIPGDPVRARWFHPYRDLPQRYASLPFAALPKVAPSRDAIVWTANNEMYGPAYAPALSPQFAPPYRAYRIAQLLRARRSYDVAYFTQMQLDVLSLPERELARNLGIPWDGFMIGSSTTATAVEALRVRLTQRRTGRMPSLLATGARARNALHGVTASPIPWRVAGADPVPHALAALGIDFLDGITLPGNGDAFTLHMQSPGYSQSFRAVWDIGNWDAGGITIPQGESGEPGSGHYIDQAAAYISGRLWPLPFSDAAIARTAVERETLQP